MRVFVVAVVVGVECPTFFILSCISCSSKSSSSSLSLSPSCISSCSLCISCMESGASRSWLESRFLMGSSCMLGLSCPIEIAFFSAKFTLSRCSMVFCLSWNLLAAALMSLKSGFPSSAFSSCSFFLLLSISATEIFIFFISPPPFFFASSFFFFARSFALFASAFCLSFSSLMSWRRAFSIISLNLNTVANRFSGFPSSRVSP
mmetsp:Transcript_46273/g.74198  ORF Transcript_46273/g.74198 Transcript_46273/m.74198 type:complete len:204 (-) Transcript_46273:243-854(-)